MTSPTVPVAIERPISREVRLAMAFLGTVANPRAPWAEQFTAWATELGLSATDAREVRVTVLRLRMFGVVDRHAARKRA